MLARYSGPECYLYSTGDFRALFPKMSDSAYKSLLRRAEKNGVLERVCRGIYLDPAADFQAGLVLYHAASRLRAGCFNYLSLETVLSEAGVVSQLPMAWITLMSSGRSNIVDCGRYGHIEFIHTKKKPESLVDELRYDDRCRLWRASVSLAVRDLKRVRRNTDLIDWEVVRELV